MPRGQTQAKTWPNGLDVGRGTGDTERMTTADDIKQLLRSAKTRDEVERIADEYRDTVRALAKSDDPADRIMAIHIVNLKAFTLRGME